MKKQNQKRLAKLLVIASLGVMLTGCGSSSSPPVGGIGGPVGGPYYPPGPGGVGNGVCYPINQPIPFSGNGVYYSGVSLIGGLLPTNAQPVGQVVLGGGAEGQYRGIGPDGTVSLNIIPTTPNATFPSSVGVTGVLYISPEKQNMMVSVAPQLLGGGGYTQPGYGQPAYGAPLCISGIALDLHPAGFGLTDRVYVYINNTLHGFKLIFTAPR